MSAKTSANMIGLGAVKLIQDDARLAVFRHRDNPKIIFAAVEETPRYLSVAHHGPLRVALEDIDVGDRVIRAGEGVINALPLGNRDDLRAFAVEPGRVPAHESCPECPGGTRAAAVSRPMRHRGASREACYGE